MPGPPRMPHATSLPLVPAGCAGRKPAAAETNRLPRPALLRHRPAPLLIYPETIMRRVEFTAEVVLHFDALAPPFHVAKAKVLKKDLPADPLPTWFLVAASAPTHFSTLTSRLQASPVALEAINVLPSTMKDSLKLHISILVLNLHFEKQISVVHTCDSWNTTTTSPLANYVASLRARSYDTPNIDRFSIEIECDIASTCDGVVEFEFAIKSVMGGLESWDNNGRQNHHATLKCSDAWSMGSPLSPEEEDIVTSPRSPVRSPSETMALKRGIAMASEAAEIDEEFWKAEREFQQLLKSSTPPRAASAPVATPRKNFASDIGSLPARCSPILGKSFIPMEIPFSNYV
ncbi:hypothetical protein HDU98_011490 [Podochytrium sp. JEL0797]|nr:hypothetical protein HDU98_011490 [Podochytrium sp. JEL0797]